MLERGMDWGGGGGGGGERACGVLKRGMDWVVRKELCVCVVGGGG